MAAAEASRVVNRCEEARATKKLDLSQCSLTRLPACLYMLMGDTQLHACDFSNNSIKNVPMQLAQTFTTLTELILHHNNISTLPDNLVTLQRLQVVDLSHNNLQDVPDVLYSLTHLTELDLADNQIKDIDVHRLQSSSSLWEVNLCGNPLTAECVERLRGFHTFTIRM